MGIAEAAEVARAHALEISRLCRATPSFPRHYVMAHIRANGTWLGAEVTRLGEEPAPEPGEIRIPFGTGRYTTRRRVLELIDLWEAEQLDPRSGVVYNLRPSAPTSFAQPRGV